MGEWATPVQPVGRHELWCVWEANGTYEWMVHPDHARDLIRTGIKVDGEWCPVEKVGEWPGIHAWQIRAIKRSVQGHEQWVKAA